MISPTNRRAVLGAVLAAGAVGATAVLPAVAAGEQQLSASDRGVLLTWQKYREQKERCHRRPQTEEECEAGYDLLFDIEHVLQADMRGGSVLALAAVLIIEHEDQGFEGEEISGLRRASLAAIRQQLVGAIAEAADRVLAEEEEAA